MSESVEHRPCCGHLKLEHVIQALLELMLRRLSSQMVCLTRAPESAQNGTTRVGQGSQFAGASSAQSLKNLDNGGACPGPMASMYYG